MLRCIHLLVIRIKQNRRLRKWIINVIDTIIDFIEYISIDIHNTIYMHAYQNEWLVSSASFYYNSIYMYMLCRTRKNQHFIMHKNWRINFLIHVVEINDLVVSFEGSAFHIFFFSKLLPYTDCIGTDLSTYWFDEMKKVKTFMCN